MTTDIEILKKHWSVGLIRLKDMPEYSAWSNALYRCENPNVRNYSRYGGRGISMCKEWKNDFWAFLAHVGLRPDSGYSIDRIDNDRDYEPGNVKWSTATEQVNNRSLIPDQRGEKCGTALLSDDQAKQIRRLALMSKNVPCMNQNTRLNSPSLREIGLMFGVSKRCVLDIKTGRTFGHLWGGH